MRKVDAELEVGHPELGGFQTVVRLPVRHERRTHATPRRFVTGIRTANRAHSWYLLKSYLSGCFGCFCLIFCGFSLAPDYMT